MCLMSIVPLAYKQAASLNEKAGLDGTEDETIRSVLSSRSACADMSLTYADALDCGHPDHRPLGTVCISKSPRLLRAQKSCQMPHVRPRGLLLRKAAPNHDELPPAHSSHLRNDQARASNGARQSPEPPLRNGTERRRSDHFYAMPSCR